MEMRGCHILARSITPAFVKDGHGNMWQYHSQSDHHSKVACWGLLFDLLRTSAQLREHVAAEKVGFGINHEMRDFKSNRKKNLDLVLCTPGGKPPTKASSVHTFAELAKAYDLELTPADSAELAELPPLQCVPVGAVHVAVEAKAAMTEHIKALPRLYDELNSSHQTIHGSAGHVIAAGLAIVNLAATFVSPNRNKFSLKRRTPVVTKHDQPKAAVRTLMKLMEIPRRSQPGETGFDALAIVVLDVRNDGSPVRLVTEAPAPPENDICHYDQAVRRISDFYAARFANI